MRLSEDKVRKLPIGTILYYNEYSPADEKTTWDDIVQVASRDKYGTPKFRILYSRLHKNLIGETYIADIYEITNGRAYAIPDKDIIIDFIFRKR
jgi:hypothetical protein